MWSILGHSIYSAEIDKNDRLKGALRPGALAGSRNGGSSVSFLTHSEQLLFFHLRSCAQEIAWRWMNKKARGQHG